MALILSPRVLKRGLQVFVLISAIAVVGVLVVTGAWQSTLDAFAQVKPVWLLAALLLASSDWFGGGLRIWLITRHVHKKTPFWGMVAAGGLTAWAAYLTPAQAGGGPVMIYTMRRFGVPLPEAMTSTLMSFFTTVIFFAIAGPLAIFLGAGRSLQAHQLVGISLYDVFKTSSAMFFTVGMVMVLAVGFPGTTRRLFMAAIGWLERHHVGRVAQRVEVLRTGVDRMHDCVIAYFRTPSGWLQVFLGVLTSGLAHANRLLAGYVAMRALGLPAHFVDVLIVQTTISFLLYFAPTPGGAGAAEGLSALLMSGKTLVPGAFLPAYTIIWRFTVSYATVIFGSFVFFKLLHGRLDEAEGTAAAPEAG